jgi:hypothetical protein
MIEETQIKDNQSKMEKIIMTRRSTGNTLIAISALLYSTHRLTAAIYGSSTTGWDSDFYQALLEYVGQELLVWSLVALIAGILYLIWAEVYEMKSGQ